MIPGVAACGEDWDADLGFHAFHGQDLHLFLSRAKNGDMSEHETTGKQDFAVLYRLAFAKYGTRALWNKRRVEEPTPEDALVVARALRIEGDRAARSIAEEIESACRAAL